jgi:hypothetical protein
MFHWIRERANEETRDARERLSISSEQRVGSWRSREDRDNMKNEARKRGDKAEPHESKLKNNQTNKQNNKITEINQRNTNSNTNHKIDFFVQQSNSSIERLQS